ncbi:hypothetical protein J4234_04030 [Candidatus Woesearchaeota archaeon]|nr:hypothetical protein [Candidatus Woesearchaeota archaeon]
MVTKEEARKYLCDTASEQCFWVNNGPILKNLEELANILPDMDNETFNHHVNNGKNDFSGWVNDVIGDKKLANDLLSSKNKESALKKVKNRLNSLKKKAG